jgi:excisionase family DNA binding protein
LLSVAEAAEFLRVSQSTVWRWINAGRLRAYRVGPKRVRLREDELVALFQPRIGVRAPGKMTPEESRQALVALDRAWESDLIVADSSVVAKIVLRENDAILARQLLGSEWARQERVIVPGLIYSEMTNVIRQRERRGLIDASQAEATLDAFFSLPPQRRSSRPRREQNAPLPSPSARAGLRSACRLRRSVSRARRVIEM